MATVLTVPPVAAQTVPGCAVDRLIAKARECAGDRAAREVLARAYVDHLIATADDDATATAIAAFCHATVIRNEAR